MKKIEKFKGVFPAFYACYEDNGDVSIERSKALLEYLIEAGVHGVYVGGSSGECIYQSVEERKAVLEAVMEQNAGRIKVIAHVACNNTKDSQELAAHAENLGVDAIAAIPPIYFKLPEAAIMQYWNDISAAAPNTDFIIYNIPQLAGVALTIPLFNEMLKNDRVIGVKNSSMPVQDIQMFRTCTNFAETREEAPIVFNGPDEQFFSGLVAGACGGIGGTYGLMPELYLAIYDAYQKGDTARGLELQDKACEIVYLITSSKANMYAIIKAVLAKAGLNLGSVRKPLVAADEIDTNVIEEAYELVQNVKRELKK